MYASNLGILIIPILAELLGGDALAAEVVTVKVENISAKLSIVFAIASNKKGDPFADAIRKVEPAILKAIAFRNALAHSLYVFDNKTGAFELFENLISDRRGKPRCKPLTAKMVQSHCDALRDAVNVILVAGGDRLKNPLNPAWP